MAKWLLTYRDPQSNTVCKEVLDKDSPRFSELMSQLLDADSRLESQRVEDDRPTGVVSQSKILRYSDKNRHNYKEAEIEYKMEQQADGSEVPRFVDFKPLIVQGIEITSTHTQEGDLLQFNVGNGGDIVPNDAETVKNLRYVLSVIYRFNNELLFDLDSDDNEEEDPIAKTL